MRGLGELLLMVAPFPEIRVAGPDELPEIERLLESSALSRDALTDCAGPGSGSVLSRR